MNTNDSLSPNDLVLPEGEHGVVDIFLRPGDYFWGDARSRIRTILGSCVAI